MAELTLELMQSDVQRLERVAARSGKTVQALIRDWIAQLLDSDEPFDITQDPVYRMEGYDSEAPTDLASNLDKYLYGGRHPE